MRYLPSFRRLLLLVASVLGLFALLPAVRAADVRLDSMRVELWPEYDQPRMLVLYSAQLAADTVFPARLEFHIPLDAGQPHAAGTERQRATARSWNRR